MSAQRAEPARAGEEKPARENPPDAESPASAPAPKAGALKAWLPLGAALLLMPALAYAVTNFVLIPHLQHKLTGAVNAPAEAAKPAPAEGGGGEGGGEAKSAVSAGQKQNVTLNKLLVNVAGTMGSRYLLTSLVLTGSAADLANRVTQNEPQLRDMASGLLSTKTIAELEKPGARNVIRGELLAGFNSILGNSVVQEIYFTEFAIQ